METCQTIVVRKKTYQVPTIQGQNDNLTLIDFLALRCYEATSVKEKEMFFEKLLKLAHPYIKYTATRYTATRYTKRDQDRQDLESILSQDLWRLINKWEPTEKYNSSCFHYLMLRQLRNQAFNELKRFTKANTPIREGDLINNSFDINNIVADTLNTQSSLDILATKDLVGKLLKNVRNDKTAELLKMALDDLPLDEVKKLTGRKSALAIKRRKESVRPIVINLMYGSCRQFIQDLTSQIEDTESQEIMSYYCIGKTVQEIKVLLKLPVKTVRNCVEKYRSVVYNLLMGN